jgi:hypothetical protein
VIVTSFIASPARKLTPGQKDANRILAVGRAGRARIRPPEHLADLTKLRIDPARATRLLRALLVLTNLEVNR